MYARTKLTNLASLGFVSNIVYWRAFGYFEPAAASKWLLHTWSLSVEWQFYLLFPLLLARLYRYRTGWPVRPAILFGFCLSLALCLVLTPVREAASFFLLPSRGWELLAGALAYFLTQQHKLPIPGESGIVLILLATFFYTDRLLFPGYLALLPVAGAFIVISGKPWSRILDTRLPQYLGDISYSLYLWHWPVYVAARYYGFTKGAFNLLFMLAISVASATLSYHLVEQRFRRFQKRPPVEWCVIKSLTLPILVIMGAMLIYLSHGLTQRMPARARATIAANEAMIDSWAYPASCGARLNMAGKIEPNYCLLHGNTDQKVMFWGDSHISQLYPALIQLAGHAGQDQSVIMATYGSCMPVRGVQLATLPTQCADFNEQVFNRALQRDIKTVVIGGFWQSYIKTLSEGRRDIGSIQRQMMQDIDKLLQHGKTVYLIMPFPTYPDSVPIVMAKALQSGKPANLTQTRREYARANATAIVWLKEIVQTTHAGMLDPAALLCQHGTCIYEQNQLSLYKDGNHLTPQGVHLVAPMLRPLFISH